MTLKELRISKGKTQNEVANLLGVSLRSYKQYENDPNKEGTIKYVYMFNEISKMGYIDEEHGLLKIDDIKNIVAEVFKDYNIEYCYLFGSYACGLATEKSDVDLLISSEVTGMSFFGLAEKLRESLHKKIDLLSVSQLNNNIELLNEILSKGIKIYG